MSICYLSQLYQAIGVLTVLPEFSIGLVGAGGGEEAEEEEEGVEVFRKEEFRP